METEQPDSAIPEQTSTAGKGIDLTPTELRLWDVLRKQPGRVFRRSELIALVMPDTVVLERTIDVHVKSLRKKLGPLGRQIETVRKAGYRFAAEPQLGASGPL